MNEAPISETVRNQLLFQIAQVAKQVPIHSALSAHR